MKFKMIVTEKGAKKLKRPVGSEIVVKGARGPLYKAIGWARPAEVAVSAEAKAFVTEPVEVDIESLRGQYEMAFGRKPDGRWKAPRLQQELSGRYQRRDMRAQD
jgi:hypothetical protein